MKRLSVLICAFIVIAPAVPASETGIDDPQQLINIIGSEKTLDPQHFAARRDLLALKEKAVPACTDGLKSSNVRVRAQCAGVLGDLGPLAEPARVELIAALNDSEREVRLSAAVALAHLSPPAGEAVAPLIGFLTLPEWANTDDLSALVASLQQAQAADALGAMGKVANTAAMPLAKVVVHGALPFARATAAEALSKIPNSTAALQYLDGELSKWASIRNVLSGSPATEIATAIVKIDRAHGQRADWGAVNVLLRELDYSADKRARAQAAVGLAAAGADDDRVPAALAQALKDPDTNVRIRAAASLLHLKSHAREATDTLQIAAQSKQQSERVLAREALSKNNIALNVTEKQEDKAQEVSVPGDEYLFR